MRRKWIVLLSTTLSTTATTKQQDDGSDNIANTTKQQRRRHGQQQKTSSLPLNGIFTSNSTSILLLLILLVLASQPIRATSSASNNNNNNNPFHSARTSSSATTTATTTTIMSRSTGVRKRVSFPPGRGGAGGAGGTGDDLAKAAKAISDEKKPLLTQSLKEKEDENNQKKAHEAHGTAVTSLSVLTKIRQSLFPIHGQQEVTKFLLMGSIKFFIVLALTLTRDTKDTLVVTSCGAEAIAFLKIYGVLPAATAFIALYSKMSDLIPNRQALFYTTCVPFFVFFAFFDTFVYPNAADKLHPSYEQVSKWLSMFGASNRADSDSDSGATVILTKIIANWTSALFYIVAEIYSSVSIGLLFWQYANDVVPVNQAKRFYPLFAQMSGFAPIFAGQYVVHYASKAPTFESSMNRLTALISFSGVMICLLYKVCCSYIERTEGGGTNSSEESTKKKKKKEKMSMVQSAKFLASSQYLRLVACLVLGYGLSINFTEIMWKSLVKKQYPNPLDYQRFMGNFSSMVGVGTCLIIMVGSQVIRALGWKVGAMATPGIMALLAVPFFACILLGDINTSPTLLSTAVIIGTIQSLLSKTSKYALFDPTTQMAYIPLDDESKVKGKAAIDVLGSRIGKSGGSFIQQFLVVAFGNIINAAPVVAVIYYGVLFTWMNAASKLSGLFHAQTEMNKANQMETAKNYKNEKKEKQKEQQQQQKH